MFCSSPLTAVGKNNFNVCGLIDLRRFVPLDQYLKAMLKLCEKIEVTDVQTQETPLTTHPQTNKIVMVISDNAVNIKAIKDILKLNQYGCFAHTLNLVANDAMN